MGDRPKAVARGELWGADCYVLDDGRRVFSQRGMVAALSGGRESGNLGAYLTKIPNLPAHLNAGASFEFVTSKDAGSAAVAEGREARFLIDVARAYVDAERAGLLHPRQKRLAGRSLDFIIACAETGIEALVDEATRYQAVREADFLERLFEKRLRAQAAPYRVTWHPDVVAELCKVFRIQYDGKTFPMVLNGVIGKLYRTFLGEEVWLEMKRRNPRGEDRDKHTQWMTEQTYGVLRDHLEVIKVLAITSTNKLQFWTRLKMYVGEPGQHELPMAIEA